MQKTRREILDYLADHPRAAAGEIARYLDLTSANIRYHLDKLSMEGLVQITSERKAGHAGRPILLYNLSPDSLGENLSHLIKSLLTVLMDSSVSARAIARAFLGDRSAGSLRGIQLLN